MVPPATLRCTVVAVLLLALGALNGARGEFCETGRDVDQSKPMTSNDGMHEVTTCKVHFCEDPGSETGFCECGSTPDCMCQQPVDGCGCGVDGFPCFPDWAPRIAADTTQVTCKIEYCVEGARAAVTCAVGGACEFMLVAMVAIVVAGVFAYRKKKLRDEAFDVRYATHYRCDPLAGAVLNCLLTGRTKTMWLLFV
jgi:hypothetical protein